MENTIDEIDKIIENDPKLKLQHNAEKQRYELSKTLRKIRETKGYSQVNISKMTGLTQQMASKIETFNGNPSLDSFLLYCSAIGVDILKLVNDKYEGEI